MLKVLKDLSATNKYGSQGGAGVIVVRTNVSDNKKKSGKNIWNSPLPLTKAQRDSVKKAKKRAKARSKSRSKKELVFFKLSKARGTYDP